MLITSCVDERTPLHRSRNSSDGKQRTRHEWQSILHHSSTYAPLRRSVEALQASLVMRDSPDRSVSPTYRQAYNLRAYTDRHARRRTLRSGPDQRSRQVSVLPLNFGTCSTASNTLALSSRPLEDVKIMKSRVVEPEEEENEEEDGANGSEVANV